MVRGISQFSENDIWESFEKIGKVKDIRKIKDRFTGDYKDFGFIEFETESEANITIDLSIKSPIRVNGCPVSVSKSKKKKAEISNFTSSDDLSTQSTLNAKNDYTQSTESNFTHSEPALTPSESINSL